MSMLKALRATGQKSAPVNVVNDDVKIVEEIDGGAKTVVRDTTPPPGARPKFKPVERSAIQAYSPEGDDTPSDNFDLVGDDIGAPAVIRNPAGRRRLYPNDAAKQAAYRERKAQEKQGG